MIVFLNIYNYPSRLYYTKCNQQKDILFIIINNHAYQHTYQPHQSTALLPLLLFIMFPRFLSQSYTTTDLPSRLLFITSCVVIRWGLWQLGS
jgi:hypothetical protein